MSIKTFAMRQTAKLIAGVVKNSSEENIARLFATLQTFTKEPAKSGLRKIEKMAREKHPMITAWKRTFQSMNPKALDKLINNLIINEFAIGEPKRQQLADEYETVLPKLVVISPTYACNLRCVGCYAGLYGNKYQLTKEEVEKIIREANELGIYFFIITGGEPFFWPHLFDILEEFDDSYFLIYTNGTLIDEKAAKKLGELGNATTAISIEGFEEDTDWRRGTGIFKKIHQAWENLRKEGVVYGASVTATRANHDTMMNDKFWDYLVDHGISYVWIFQYMPVGLNPTMDLVPTPEQRLERFRKAEELRLGGKFALFADFWNHGPLVHGCLAGGAKYLHINAKGYAEPCVFQHFATDSIREKSLLEIIKSPYFEAWKRMVPYNNNLLRPCPIIDNPKVFRAMVKAFNAKPTHDGAEKIITDLAPAIDQMAEKWAELSDKVWIEEGYADRYPAKRGVYNYETRKKRYANNEEKLALDKKA